MFFSKTNFIPDYMHFTKHCQQQDAGKTCYALEERIFDVQMGQILAHRLFTDLLGIACSAVVNLHCISRLSVHQDRKKHHDANHTIWRITFSFQSPNYLLHSLGETDDIVAEVVD